MKERDIKLLDTLHSMLLALQEGGATVERHDKLVLINFHHGAHHADVFEACIQILDD